MKPINVGDHIALIDDEFYPVISKFTWSFNRGYAMRVIKGTNYFETMQTLVMGNPRGQDVIDHINGDGLDNRTCNLRIITRQQNAFNSKSKAKHARIHSIYKGVVYRTDRKKWVAIITLNAKQRYLGQYQTEQEAALAYNKAAKELFGEYAKLNKIDNMEGN